MHRRKGKERVIKSLEKKNVKQKDEDTKLIGAYVSRYVSNYLSMICIERRVNKSVLMREIIQNYVHTKTQAGIDESVLVENIARMIQNEWNMYRTVNSDLGVEEFQKELNEYKTKSEEMLKYRGVDPEWVEKIIERIHL